MSSTDSFNSQKWFKSKLISELIFLGLDSNLLNDFYVGYCRLESFTRITLSLDILGLDSLYGIQVN